MAPTRKVSNPGDLKMLTYFKFVKQNDKIKYGQCTVKNRKGYECGTRVKADQNGKIQKHFLERHLRTHKTLYTELQKTWQNNANSNEAAPQTEPAEKQPQLDNNKRWTDIETQSLVETVAALVKGAPDLFEKPTADEFYKIVIATSTKLADVDAAACASKMSQLQESYNAAVEWMRSDNAKDKAVPEYIKENCPHYEHLKSIFSEAPSSQHEDEAADLPCGSIVHGLSNDKAFAVLYASDDEEGVTVTEEYSLEEETRAHEHSCPRHAPACNQQKFEDDILYTLEPYAMLAALYGRKMRMEHEQIRHEMKVAMRELAIKELELRLDHEIRKLQIETDARIKICELELKIKYQNNECKHSET